MVSGFVKSEFEVFGQVQGVFFRKYTKEEAERLGLKGWCANTNAGTVKGLIEGPQEKIKLMKEWLQHKGSPQSKIERTVFSDEEQIESRRFAT
ncbi:acylphosphatase-2-like isoform X3 [Artemia franciscana]|uniref:acylphosphatase-2-like isoform X3 n=1 Tax=Artemia franciscana TaxID=6661 RepID=UPI0032DBC764